jgi:hypothetical protein
MLRTVHSLQVQVMLLFKEAATVMIMIMVL